MNRSFYSDTITNFCLTSSAAILGVLAANNEFSLEQTQRIAWEQEILILNRGFNKLPRQNFFLNILYLAWGEELMLY